MLGPAPQRELEDGAGAAGLPAEVITREICRAVAKLSGEEVVGSRETILAASASASAPDRRRPARRPSPFASTWADHFGDASPRAVPGEGGAPAPGVPAGRPRPLAGALPGPCQQDLELLQDTIRELAGGRPGGQPVPADQFGAVFLTGATGFVGRFVLSELLRRSDHMLVHCLVRAPDAKQALARVQDALESAGLWDDFLGDRIRAWPGDLREPRFGLPELDFRRLCDQVDAVYHLAAEVNLLSPYAALREASTSGARTVL